MGVLEDFIGMLDRIPIWKRLGQVPAEIDELKQQMAALEERLKVVPGETCPACGERAMRLTFTSGVRGSPPNQYRRDEYRCAKCEHTEERAVNFGKSL